ncbi:MAG: STAS domain-containing protein, partial [bacterium]|nr:STAS domain-containing protein [bacterium]
IEGDLIFENADKAKELILSGLDKIDNTKVLTIDCAKMKEIDSSGFQLLLALDKTLKDQEIRYAFKNVRKEIYDLVNLAGLNKYFRIQTADLLEG